MATILMPLPATDFDPTESGVPWRMLTAAGHAVVFATPEGQPAQADPRMLTGAGLGPFRPFLVADRHGQDAYRAMAGSEAFARPLRHDQARVSDFDAILLPGGHAPGMRPYLESTVLQALVSRFFAEDRIVAAVCHGVLLAARARHTTGRSVLHGRRTTALLQRQERLAWRLTHAWAGDYYLTYPETVQAEVSAQLASPRDFEPGPAPLLRDAPGKESRGFALRDGRYLSARWPGDAHRFAQVLAAMLEETR